MRRLDAGDLQTEEETVDVFQRESVSFIHQLLLSPLGVFVMKSSLLNCTSDTLHEGFYLKRRLLSAQTSFMKVLFCIINQIIHTFQEI